MPYASLGDTRRPEGMARILHISDILDEGCTDARSPESTMHDLKFELRAEDRQPSSYAIR